MIRMKRVKVQHRKDTEQLHATVDGEAWPCPQLTLSLYKLKQVSLS